MLEWVFYTSRAAALVLQAELALTCLLARGLKSTAELGLPSPVLMVVMLTLVALLGEMALALVPDLELLALGELGLLEMWVADLLLRGSMLTGLGVGADVGVILDVGVTGNVGVVGLGVVNIVVSLPTVVVMGLVKRVGVGAVLGVAGRLVIRVLTGVVVVLLLLLPLVRLETLRAIRERGRENMALLGLMGPEFVGVVRVGIVAVVVGVLATAVDPPLLLTTDGLFLRLCC